MNWLRAEGNQKAVRQARGDDRDENRWEETVGFPPSEENELAVTASEETPTEVPQSAEPIEAPSPTEGKAEEAVIPLEKKKKGRPVPRRKSRAR